MELSRRKFLGGVAASSALAAQEKRGLKIFMHWDMEGSSAIFTREQAWYWENGVREQVAAEARELFTADVIFRQPGFAWPDPRYCDLRKSHCGRRSSRSPVRAEALVLGQQARSSLR